MNTNDLAKYAAMFAAGSITHDELTDQFGDDIAGQIIGLAGGSIVGGIAGGLASTAVDVGREIPVVSETIEVVDDVLEGATDFVEDLFGGW